MILLIQFRTDQSGWHEIKSVYEATGLTHDKFTIVNASNESVTTSDISDLAQRSDLVLLGGVGESGYEANTKKAKEVFAKSKGKIANVIPQLAEENIPTLGLCFGHQLIADSLGGVAETADRHAETGVAEIQLTEDGKQDQLLSVMDNSFSAIVGHKVSVTELPDNCTLLARSQNCPIQSFRHKDNMYGFQFHPELDKQALKERLEMYPEYKNNKVTSAENNQTIITERILKRAIDLFA